MAAVEVPVALLREAAELVLARLDEAAGPVVSVPDDYFWAVGPRELFDVQREPTDLTIGQVSECVESLRSLVEDPDRATTYALVWLADLLRAAGTTVVR